MYNINMRRLIILFILIYSIILPCFAYNDKAANESLSYLNDCVYEKIPQFKRILYNDYEDISRITKLHKQNIQFVKTKAINDFSLACQKRHETLLSIYENEFFKPAYKKYVQSDKSLTYEQWKDSVALSELSLFYDFYTLTENNLQNCQRIFQWSTNH